MSLHTIKFSGFLKDKYGPGAVLAGHNMWQVMQGLIHRFGPQFKEDIASANWHVLVGAKKAKKDLGEEDLTKHIPDRLIHLIPAVEGSSGGVRVIVGAVMVVVGVIYAQPWLVNMGAALALGGAIEVLFKPKTATPATDKADQAGSAIYNGPVNITEQGVPVPVICGRVGRASSVVISTDFSSEEVL